MITILRFMVVSLAFLSFIVSMQVFERHLQMTTAWTLSIAMTIIGFLLTGIFIEKNRGIVASTMFTNGAFACLGLYLLSYGEQYQQFIMILGYVMLLPTGITVFYIKQNIKNRKRVLQRQEKKERTIVEFFENIEERKELFQEYKKDFGFWAAFKVAIIGEEEDLQNALDFELGMVVEVDEDYTEV